jgi:DNA-binding CsgD family transcriptional regulator
LEPDHGNGHASLAALHGEEVLRDVTVEIARGGVLGDLLNRVVGAAMDLSEADSVTLSLASADGRMVEVAACVGQTPELVGARPPVGASLSGFVLRSGQPLCSKDLARDRRRDLREVPRLSPVRGVLVVPLIAPGGPMGTLTLGKAQPWRFPSIVQARVDQLAACACVAIQNALLRGQARGAAATTIGACTPGGASDGGEEAPSDVRLTKRQREIIELLIAGQTCKEIAANLGISTRTIEHHLERLKLRFGQARLHALAAYLAAHGVGTTADAASH